VRCSLVIDEIPEVPIVVAVGVELEADDTVTVGVDHREDRLRVRIERELLVLELWLRRRAARSAASLENEQPPA
jgi:hypothetical protein